MKSWKFAYFTVLMLSLIVCTLNCRNGQETKEKPIRIDSVGYYKKENLKLKSIIANQKKDIIRITKYETKVNKHKITK